MRNICVLICLIQIIVIDINVFAQSPEDNIQKYRSSLYKIVVVEKSSGEKSSQGTGFQVSKDGLIATNYHVVSKFLLEPEKYNLESIDYNDLHDNLKVVKFDVVNDLALVRGKQRNDENYFRINKNPPSHGSKIFAIGNPLSVGMTIVEGNYNGLEEKSLNECFNFSGSLNSGMSGGPAITSNGEVIGVNVATLGQQVSFLVPAKFLNNLLLKKTPKLQDGHVFSMIENQLLQFQDDYIKKLMDTKWKLKDFGPAKVPDKLSSAFQTWGGNNENELHLLYKEHNFKAFVNAQTYVTDKLITGKIFYQYYWLESKGLNEIRFYNLVSEYLGKYIPTDSGDEKQVTAFTNRSDFVRLGKMTWKVNYCVRNYKKYPSLYDVVINMASLDKSDNALIIWLTLSGVSKNNALLLNRKFLENVKWVK